MKHEKHHLNAYRSAQVVTLFIFNTINILPFIRKKLENPAPVYLDVVLFTKKKYDDGFRKPLEIATFFFFHQLDQLTGIKAKIWVWEIGLFQFMHNNILVDLGIDHDKRFISFIRAGFFSGIVRTNEIT